MPVDAVIFDIGNVLIEWQPERFYDQAIGPQRRKALFDALDLHQMNDRIDRGGHFRDTIYDFAQANPDWADEIRMWHDNWIEMAAPAIPQSVRLLRALRARSVPVLALSNFGIQNFDFAEREHYPFLGEFDQRFISGHMQMAKPDHDIYAAVEAQCGFAPETLLFADDRADNIATAQARGWQVHLFDGPQGWADRLVAEGLLTAEEAA